MNNSLSLRLVKEALATELQLFLKTWNMHWNIEGGSFKELHDLFGDQYGQLNSFVDDLAERVRQLGEKVAITPKAEDNKETASKMVDELMLAHQALSTKFISSYVPQLEKAGDYGSMDLLIKIAQWHDKQAWFLRSYTKVN